MGKVKTKFTTVRGGAKKKIEGSEYKLKVQTIFIMVCTFITLQY